MLLSKTNHLMQAQLHSRRSIVVVADTVQRSVSTLAVAKTTNTTAPSTTTNKHCFFRQRKENFAFATGRRGFSIVPGFGLEDRKRAQNCTDCSCWSNSSNNNNGQRRYHSSSLTAADDSSPEDELQIPGAQKGGRKLAIVFTCTVCDTRSAKQFTENAYRNGVVIVQCPGCQSRHLIADNLGFFEDMPDGWNIEKALKEKIGEGSSNNNNNNTNFRVVTNEDVLELSIEDLVGEEKIRDALSPENEERILSAS